MTKTLKIYGLDYCSTVQKARKALEDAGWQIEFHDVKANTPDRAEWTKLLDAFVGDREAAALIRPRLTIPDCVAAQGTHAVDAFAAGDDIGV